MYTKPRLNLITHMYKDDKNLFMIFATFNQLSEMKSLISLTSAPHEHFSNDGFFTDNLNFYVMVFWYVR